MQWVPCLPGVGLSTGPRCFSLWLGAAHGECSLGTHTLSDTFRSTDTRPRVSDASTAGGLQGPFSWPPWRSIVLETEIKTKAKTKQWILFTTMQLTQPPETIKNYMRMWWSFIKNSEVLPVIFHPYFMLKICANK